MKHHITVVMGIAALLGCALGAGPQAVAHHSFAMFDKQKYVEMKGVVRRIEWQNPHAYLYVDVPNKSGGSDSWTVECVSPNELSHWGWQYGTVKVGDKVTVGLFPLRNGTHGGAIYSVTLANGTVLKGN